MAKLALDEMYLNALPRLTQEHVKLHRFSGVHWVNVPPLAHLGWCLEEDTWRAAMRLRLGIIVSANVRNCPFCSQRVRMDKLGHHALECAATGSLIIRHNRIRDFVASAGQWVGCRYKIEFRADPDTRQRQGDVALWGLIEPQTALIDVAIISAFARSHRVTILRRGAGRAATAYEDTKRRNYRLLNRAQWRLFCFIVESTGAFSREAKEVIELIRKRDEERNIRRSSPTSRYSGIDKFVNSAPFLPAPVRSPPASPPHVRWAADDQG